MATIPSFESILLEVHQSLGLKLESEKDKRKLAQLEKPLADHTKIMAELIDEIFTSLGMDPPAMGDAHSHLDNFGNFNSAVEQSTWTYEADKCQIVWFLAGYSYAPGLGRLAANWNLEQPLDKGMPGGRFWYLPEIRERDGAKQLVMPVAQVMEWLMDLLDQPMDHLASELGKRGNVEADTADTIKRTLYEWLKGDVPRVDNIERYFAEGTALTFKGALVFDGPLSLEQRFKTALEFVKRKGLNAKELRKQIPMPQPELLEAILNGVASDDMNWHFTDLLADRYASPSLRTIRQRLLIARATQDGYRRLVKLLLGKDFDETCVDHSVNKVLQLFEIFKSTYNLTVEAYEHCGEDEVEENKYFESKITPWDKFGILLSVLPSMREIAPFALGFRFSRLFSELSPGEPLEDHVGHDEASSIPVIERNCAREFEEQTKVQEAAKELKFKPHWSKLQGITNYWVASLLAQHPELSLKVRRQVATRMRELAQSPKEVLGAIVMELGQLHNNEDSLHRPKDTKARVEVLLEEAKASPAFNVWRATILYYEAKHHLAFNDFDTARRLFDQSLEACHERSFGKLRGQVARDAFALEVERPPKGFSLGNYDRYYRNMLAYGCFEGEFTGTLPSLEDSACEVAEYFWETLYRPYFGEENEQPLVKEQWEQLCRGTIDLIYSGDWIGLTAWFKKNPALRDKRLREVRGNTALMIWLKMLYEFEMKQPSLGVMAQPDSSEALVQFSGFLKNWHEAIRMMIDEWPKLVNMADFKKQTPLMLATNHGDLVVVRKLLQAEADTLQQDFRGRTALHAAVATRSIQCVEELIAHTPGVTSIMTLDGQTVLHTAVRAGHPAIVKALIKHAPELKTCRNEHQQTALDLAKSLLINPAAMEFHRQYMTSEGRKTGSSIDYQEIVSALSAE